MNLYLKYESLKRFFEIKLLSVFNIVHWTVNWKNRLFTFKKLIRFDLIDNRPISNRVFRSKSFGSNHFLSKGGFTLKLGSKRFWSKKIFT